MRRVILDTTTCSTTAELHAALQSQLALPDYYGKNLDALWDALTGWIELPVTVEWRGFAPARAAIGEDASRVLATFRRAEGIGAGLTVEVVGDRPDVATARYA